MLKIIIPMMLILIVNLSYHYSYGQGTDQDPKTSNNINFTNVCEDQELCTQYATNWWKWAYETPKSINPILGSYEDDFRCGIGQNGTVWNLGGSWDASPVKRNCTITSDKTIFSPVVNSGTVIGEQGTGLTEKSSDVEILKFVRDAQAKIKGISATLNGTQLPLTNLETAVLGFNLPKDNIYGLETGIQRGAGNGSFIGIKDLDPGNYELIFKGGTSNDLLNPDPNSFGQLVTYNLRIIDPKINE